ncbi:MAG: S66 peptidase family protein [Actinomycetota bacterium]
MKARPLPPGGTIGVPAPASPWDERSEVDRGVRWWESNGYRVKLGEGIWERDDYLAGNPKTRARDLRAMFEDPEVDVVQVFGGGYGAAEVAPLLDLDAIAANPKPFVGFSDITVLHLAIRQATGLVTFHGPGFGGVGAPKTEEFTRDRLLRSLTVPTAIGEIPPRPDDPYVGALGSGRVTAPLVGGCLWLLADSLATPWQVETHGRILFFEDLHTPSWMVDSELTHLRNAGKLDGVVAVVAGEMFQCEDWRFPDPGVRTKSMEDVFERHFEPMGIPVVFNLPLGHGKHLATIPLGVTATVDADARTLTIDEPALEPVEGGEK